MKVIFDTNILWENRNFSSSEFNALSEFMDKNQHHFSLPLVVLNEIGGILKREINDSINKLETEMRKFNKFFSVSNGKIEINFEFPNSDQIEQNVRVFLDSTKSSLKLKDSDIYSWKPEYLEQIIWRAVNRSPPMHKKGEEFRDCIIWLTLLDIAQTDKDKSIIFISKNSNEFGKEQLLPILRKEAEDRGLTVHYYNSIQDLIKSHSSTDSDVSKEWIDKTIPLKIDECFSILFNTRYLSSLEKWLKGHGLNPVGKLEHGEYEFEYKNHFVYNLKDNSRFISIKYLGHFAVKLENEEEDYPSDIITYGGQSFEFDFCDRMVPYRSRGRKIFQRTLKYLIAFSINFTENNGTVENMDVGDIQFVKPCELV